MIYNITNYSKIPYDDLKKFADEYAFEVKELIYIVGELDEFKTIYENITSMDYRLNDKYVEGFVIEDNNDYMVKIKTNYYDTWKYIRTKMENALKNHNYNFKYKSKLEELFMQYLQMKYENTNYDMKKINIIDERNEFEKGGGININKSDENNDL